MIRIELNTILILREAFYFRKAFLTFVYSPYSLNMSAYNLSYCREVPLVILLSLHLLFFPNFSQSGQISPEFETYYQKAEEDSLSTQTRIRLLQIAYQSLKHTTSDSLKYSRLSKVVVLASHLKDTIFFQKVVLEGLELAQFLEKPALVADAHWNYGSYYLNKKNFESSYYHYNSAFKLFTSINNNYYAGKMLYNMAFISSQTNDFTGAEILLFRSIKNFEKAKKFKQLYLCYNLLGTNADDMEEYEKALDYYTKASSTLHKVENSKYFKLELWNNMGVRLHKLKQFKQAIAYFDKALIHQEYLSSYPSLYAKLLDNKAFSLVALGTTKNIQESMETALALRDSIDDTAGGVVSRLRFASYYAKLGDTLNGISYANAAFNLAEANQLTRDVLNALELLAALDKENELFYLQKHIGLTKALYARDRNLRNKFTAIQYETNKYMRVNKRLFRQRLWITIGATVITLLLLLIYLNSRQRSKNKELLFEREQQQYNEDMFLMAMENKTTLERGRNQERLRISEELHDGILARLFAIRFKWSFIDLKGKAEDIAQHHNSIHQLTDIESAIRNISHDLRNELIWEELGFKHEIENCIKERSEIGNFNTTLHYSYSEQWERLDYLYKINICRMLDEILQNIIKHANATTVAISFLVEEDLFIISVTDNGMGFNKGLAKKGIGLKNLKARANKLNGELAINSKIGTGTTVAIHFSKNMT
jgi:signal transduction histidine kinase